MNKILRKMIFLFFLYKLTAAGGPPVIYQKESFEKPKANLVRVVSGNTAVEIDFQKCKMTMKSQDTSSLVIESKNGMWLYKIKIIKKPTRVSKWQGISTGWTHYVDRDYEYEERTPIAFCNFKEYGINV